MFETFAEYQDKNLAAVSHNVGESGSPWVKTTTMSLYNFNSFQCHFIEATRRWLIRPSLRETPIDSSGLTFNIESLLAMPSADAEPIHHAEVPLPTLSKLGDPLIPADLDAVKIAKEWLSSFANFTQQGDVNGILSLILDSQFSSNIFKPTYNDNFDHSDTDFAVYWRDLLVFTWDFRTFEGTPKIKQFLVDRLGQLKTISKVQLHDGPQLVKPYPDLAWIQLSFSFETQIGLGTGIVRAVPVSTGPNANGNVVWKAHSIFTNLDGLKGFPEKVGAFRNPEPNHGKWEAQRQKELRFEDKDPEVLVIGAGHSGLAAAARLKALEIPTLVVDRNARIGDNWRSRYEALCLHDPVCEWSSSYTLDEQLNTFSIAGYDHMPYFSYDPLLFRVFSFR